MTVTNYLWDEDSYLEEYDDVSTTAAYTNEPTEFGSVVSQHRDSTTSFYHYDALGSTHQLTDQAENIKDTFLYDAWGNEVTRTGTTTTPFRYIGEFGYYFNEEADSYYVRARVYQPMIGQWLSTNISLLRMESEINFKESANSALLNSLRHAQYNYLQSNPINYIDPRGTLLFQTNTIYSNIENVSTLTQSFTTLETCEISICSSPVTMVKGLAGHLFLLCDGQRYRGGPRKWDPKCCKKKYDQLHIQANSWDEKPLDHPENPKDPYDKSALKCKKVILAGSCNRVCGCFKKVLSAINKCCITYNGAPVLDDHGNSNSAVGWMLKSCIKFDGVWKKFPGGIRPNVGMNKGIPKCVQKVLHPPEQKILK